MDKLEKESNVRIGKRCFIISILGVLLGDILLFANLQSNFSFVISLDIYLVSIVLIFLGTFLYFIAKRLEK